LHRNTARTFKGVRDIKPTRGNVGGRYTTGKTYRSSGDASNLSLGKIMKSGQSIGQIEVSRAFFVESLWILRDEAYGLRRHYMEQQFLAHKVCDMLYYR
jgi:hypothetical protein